MTIRHIVLFELTDDAEGEAFAQISREVDALLHAIPGVQQYQSGPNVNRDPKRRLMGLTMVFDNYEGLQTYGAHENHHAAVQLLKPYLKDAWIMQMEI
ncbi:MAG: Dabb family protein [Burkholderiaceae bacterium]